MKGREPKVDHPSRFPFVGVLIALLGLVILTGFVDKEVLQELEALKSAQTDNIEWAMSQSEVEYLRFRETLSVDPKTATAQDLAEIRLRFDLFYSRIDLLLQGQLFAPLKDEPSFHGPLLQIQTVLSSLIEVMDGPDTTLVQALPNIVDTIHSMRTDIRSLALDGVAFFARQSDQQRTEISGTLTRLIYLTGALLLFMGALSVGLIYINLQKMRQSTQIVQANSRLQGILETSLDGVIVANKQGEILTLNPAAEKIFGYLADDVLGLPVGDLIVPDHHRKAHRAGIARLEVGGEQRLVGKGRKQLEACRHDGTVFPIEMALASISEGKDEVYVAFLRDISQAKDDEKELIQARDRALAGEKAKTDFLTVMSHEIRTPLNGILGNLQLLFRNKNNPRTLKMLRDMDISGQLLLRHVNAVLDIVSAEAGMVSTREEPMNPGIMVQKIIDAQNGAAAERGNVIEWSSDGPPQDWILSDEHKLEQILLNLVGNAIKFTREGRISIEIALNPAPSGDCALKIKVKDTGIGIAEGQLDKVFEDFQTFDSSLDRSSPGTGLGLGIARRFAVAMGGEIEVRSTLGHGSQFEVTLPVKRAPQPPAAETQENSSPVVATKLDILIVDDNQINLDVMAAMLIDEGHQVTCASSGPEAIQLAASRLFDVVLMDISMPGMDGVTATTHIRESGGLSAHVPVFAVSANVLPQDTQTYLDSGMAGVLGKPLSFEALKILLTTAGPSRPPLELSVVLIDNRQLKQLQKTLALPALASLFERMLGDADTLLRDLNPSSDLPEMAVRSHNIAGSAAMFGAERFHAILNEVENACLSGDAQALAALLPTLKECWCDSRSALEVWHEKLTA